MLYWCHFLLRRSYSTSVGLLSVSGPLRVCVIGSGVAGLSTAHHLIKHNPDTKVDVVEKFPVPFGLIRYGVAPDHSEVKNCTNHLTNIAELSNCRFIGNAALGRDFSLSELQSLYHAVVLAYGAEDECKLGIPGEDLPGVYSAKAFFGWYNGLPMHKELNPDLSGEVAVIIGQGNVALDIARVLLTPTKLLEHTDICDHALRALCESRIRKVYLIGRKGPLQVMFSTKEMRTMSKLPGCRFYSDPSHFDQIGTITDLPRPKRRLLELMMKVTDTNSQNTMAGSQHKEWNLSFMRTPIEIIADKFTGRAAKVRLEINRLEGGWNDCRVIGTRQYEEISCNMVLRSIGFQTKHVEGVPFEKTVRVIPNTAGRVTQGRHGAIIPGLYCSGWVKTGPVGAVLNTMSSAYETAENIIQDHNEGKLKNLNLEKGSLDIKNILSPASDTVALITSFSDWKLIDKMEQLMAKNQKKPREKIVSFEEMLKIIK